MNPELVTRFMGEERAVSPVITIEPRRRKFLRPVKITLPIHYVHAGRSGQLPFDPANCRLFCSISGELGYQNRQFGA